MLDACNRHWIPFKLKGRITQLIRRASERLEGLGDRCVGAININPEHADSTDMRDVEKEAQTLPTDDLHRTVLRLDYELTALTSFMIAPSIHFHLLRQVSRSGRPYLGVMPRPLGWQPKGLKKPLRTLDTEPFHHPLITTDLSKLGKRRLYSRVRAAVWREVERLEGEEERAWKALAEAGRTVQHEG